MVLFIAGSIYLPGVFVKPKYDFLYFNPSNEYYSSYGWQPFIVQSGHLARNPQPKPLPQNYGNTTVPPQPEPEWKLYRHSVTNNESREVAFDEAAQLTLDTNQMSPDKFVVVNSYGGGDFLFPFFYGGGGEQAVYLKGHNIAKQMNIQKASSYYYDFRFLGWITK
mgnify:CR=1 FL=1